MKSHLNIWLLVCFFVLIISQNGSAQDVSEQEGFFDAIKDRMTSVAQENKRLTQENQALKTRLTGLQLEVEQYEQEVKALDPQYVTPYEQSIKDTSGDEALIREVQNIYVSGKTMDLDERQRLEELRLYDLQYQKQELQLDLKAKEAQYQKMQEKGYPGIDILKRDIEKNKTREKDLSFKIAEQEKAASAYARQIDLLKAENKELEKKIKMLKRMSAE